ncbi:CU044_5270 family protein [Streptosporangium sp. NPDC000396]|uniref:CU044_5270 family protein n=1 Tax=Streptosporangium sp. NPDC000396 TaxID=3366185 RepID=UPI00368B1F57
MLKEFRRDTPAMTREAEDVARARLLAAMREPAPEPRRSRPRMVWRLALAGALMAAVGAGMLVTNQKEAVMAPVASVRELSELAARAAENDVTPPARAGQWLYIKELQAKPVGGTSFAVDLSQRVTRELWTSADGKKVAWRTENGELLIQGTLGISSADLAAKPITPEGVLERIRKSFSKGRALARTGPDFAPEEKLFRSILQLMGEQALVPEVRAALFRALPSIPGVTVKQDVKDADGRRGVAFGYTGSWSHLDLILDPTDFRYLGTYGITVKDRTFEYDDVGRVDVPANTVFGLSAQLETKVVDKPGQK